MLLNHYFCKNTEEYKNSLCPEEKETHFLKKKKKGIIGHGVEGLRDLQKN